MFGSIRKNIPLPIIFIEFLSIILAVLLAFFVNEWRQNRTNIRLADIALQNIVEELNQNKNFLEINSPYHEELYNNLNKKEVQLQDGSLKLKDLAIFDADIPINIVRLKEIAWVATNETQVVVHLDYILVKDLFNIYHIQKEYNLLVQTFFNNMFNNLDFYDNNRTKDVLNLMITMFRNIVQMEKTMIKMYEKSIIQIEQYLKEH